jgi:TonB family protein
LPGAKFEKYTRWIKCNQLNLIIMKSIPVIIFLFFFNIGFNVLAQDKNPVNNVDTISCIAHDTTVMINVQIEARFQGGDIVKFRNYVSRNIRYPVEAQIKNEQGKVYVSFIVDWDGMVKRIKIYKTSGSKLLDAEAIRVIALSPRWTPAKNNNTCVPQQLILPLVFKSLGIIDNKQLELLNKGM